MTMRFSNRIRKSIILLLCLAMSGGLKAQSNKPEGTVSPQDPFQPQETSSVSSESLNLYEPGALAGGEIAGEEGQAQDSAAAEDILENNLLTEQPEQDETTEELTLSGKPQSSILEEREDQGAAAAGQIPESASTEEAQLLQNLVDGVEVMEQMKFAPDQTERADLLVFRQRGRLVKIKPYFLESGQPGEPAHASTQELASYFVIEPEKAAQLSTQALEMTRKLLDENSVKVITRNRAVRMYDERSPIYAFLYVNGRPLEELLLLEGLVKPEGEQAVTPTGMHVGEYYGRLRFWERKARQAEAGGWQRADSVIRAERRILD